MFSGSGDAGLLRIRITRRRCTAAAPGYRFKMRRSKLVGSDVTTLGRGLRLWLAARNGLVHGRVQRQHSLASLEHGAIATLDHDHGIKILLLVVEGRHADAPV